MAKIEVRGTEIRLLNIHEDDYISLTNMLKAKDGDFFASDRLRNRNTVEYFGIWEKIYNPYFKYGEFDLIKSQAGLNKGMMDNSKAEFEEWMPAHKVIRGLLYTFDD